MTGWTRGQYHYWNRIFLLYSVGPAFLWLLFDSVIAGAALITGLSFAYWSWIESGRDRSLEPIDA